MALVHVVLVNWNGHRDTMECLESLLRLEDDNFCVTVCDNGSTDGSVEKLTTWLASEQTAALGSEAVWAHLRTQRRHQPTFQVIGPDVDGRAGAPFVTIIDARQNLGFAGGNNTGISRALADPECQFVWLLNNDTVASPTALSALVSAMQQEPDLAICGSTLLFYHAPETVQGLGGWFSLVIARGSHIGLFEPANALPPRAEVEAKIAYVMGASMFVRRAVLERSKGMSEDYFLYYEEQDLAEHLLLGERQGWAPGSVVFHKEGGSIGTSSRSRPSDTSLYYLQINTLRFYRKFYPWLLPVAFARLARDAVGAWRRNDVTALFVSRMAIADFLAGRKQKGIIKLVTKTSAERSVAKRDP